MLTARGEQIAVSLLRRHWVEEQFLIDVLEVPWSEVHELASELEHAASEVVTERLAAFLGEPAHCLHGGPVPSYVSRRSRNLCCVSAASRRPARRCRWADVRSVCRRISGGLYGLRSENN